MLNLGLLDKDIKSSKTMLFNWPINTFSIAILYLFMECLNRIMETKLSTTLPFYRSGGNSGIGDRYNINTSFTPMFQAYTHYCIFASSNICASKEPFICLFSEEQGTVYVK